MFGEKKYDDHNNNKGMRMILLKMYTKLSIADYAATVSFKSQDIYRPTKETRC
jgi:hypothetical protein